MTNDNSDHSTEEAKRLEEEIKQLKAKGPKLLDILIASPFDDELNIDEKFTEDIFYRKELFVEDDYKEHETKLIKIINDDLQRNSMILLSGHGGTGKSTFIETFIRRTPSFTHHPLTFDEKSKYNPSTNTDDEILNLIKKYLEDIDDIHRTIDFVIDNRAELKARQLISDKLYKYKSRQRRTEKSTLDVMTKVFDIKDAFTCFFCHFFLNHLQEKKMTIIYFDNLDNVKPEFLSASFLHYFNESIVDANDLKNIGYFAGKGISLSNFRFIFSLRDANAAVANPHLASRQQFNNVVSFKVAFKPARYRGILERRIAFLPEVFDEDQRFNEMPLSKIREFFNILIERDHFQRMCSPHNDYRTVVTELMRVLNSEDLEGLTKDLSYGWGDRWLNDMIKHIEFRSTGGIYRSELRELQDTVEEYKRLKSALEERLCSLAKLISGIAFLVPDTLIAAGGIVLIAERPFHSDPIEIVAGSGLIAFVLVELIANMQHLGNWRSKVKNWILSKLRRYFGIEESPKSHMPSILGLNSTAVDKRRNVEPTDQE